MAESSHDRLEKIRKPRVHIRIDVETEGGKIQEELPFVVGILGEFSGDQEAQQSLREREFVGIDDANFNEVMEKMAPTLQYKVEDALRGGDREIAVDLKFREMEDFEPANVAAQVEPLRKLMETRNRLRDLAAQADRDDRLEDLLERVITDTEKTIERPSDEGAGTGDDA